jgi:hypothetical protein
MPRCPRRVRHHTRLEVPSPPAWRVQSPRGGQLGDLESMLCPQAVLCTGVAACRALAREGPARGRGRTRFLWRANAAGAGARAGVQAKVRARGSRASVCQSGQRRRPLRLRAHCPPAPPLAWPGRPQAHPLCASSPLRNGSRAQAVLPWRMESTARARRWATIGSAGPVSGFFSQRPRDF